MSSLITFGVSDRAIDQRKAGNSRNIGQKIYFVALRIVPDLIVFIPALSGGAATIGGYSRGASRITGVSKRILDGH